MGNGIDTQVMKGFSVDTRELCKKLGIISDVGFIRDQVLKHQGKEFIDFILCTDKEYDGYRPNPTLYYRITTSMRDRILKSYFETEFSVNTREIWEGLGIKTSYRHWISRCIKKLKWTLYVDYVWWSKSDHQKNKADFDLTKNVKSKNETVIDFDRSIFDLSKNETVIDFDITKNVTSKLELNNTGRGGDRRSKTYYITKEASLLLRQLVSPDGLEILKKTNKLVLSGVRLDTIEDLTDTIRSIDNKLSNLDADIYDTEYSITYYEKRKELYFKDIMRNSAKADRAARKYTSRGKEIPDRIYEQHGKDNYTNWLYHDEYIDLAHFAFFVLSDLKSKRDNILQIKSDIKQINTNVSHLNSSIKEELSKAKSLLTGFDNASS